MGAWTLNRLILLLALSNQRLPDIGWMLLRDSACNLNSKHPASARHTLVHNHLSQPVQIARSKPHDSEQLWIYEQKLLSSAQLSAWWVAQLSSLLFRSIPDMCKTLLSSAQPHAWWVANSAHLFRSIPDMCKTLLSSVHPHAWWVAQLS